jgi:hypothetical protein
MVPSRSVAEHGYSKILPGGRTLGSIKCNEFLTSELSSSGTELPRQGKIQVEPKMQPAAVANIWNPPPACPNKGATVPETKKVPGWIVTDVMAAAGLVGGSASRDRASAPDVIISVVDQSPAILSTAPLDTRTVLIGTEANWKLAPKLKLLWISGNRIEGTASAVAPITPVIPTPATVEAAPAAAQNCGVVNIAVVSYT